MENGTRDGASFLQKYFATRELVDVYSSKWMKKSAARGGRFGKEVLSGFNAKFGTQYQGHLLLLAIDEYRHELKNDIKGIFPFLTGNSIGEDGFPRIHDADFLFINIATKQVLAFGLGRKNRLFISGYDPSDNYLKRILNLNLNDDLTEFGSERQPPFIKKFLALDHARVVPFLINALCIAGEGWEDWNTGEFEEMLEKGADKDGLFRDSDGQEYSKDEMTEIVSELHDAKKKIDDGEAPFLELFKDCDILSWAEGWELASE